ncbi:MAG: heme ABC exporter ATP-binding protein CcmA [Acidobacteriota bacterium]|nr:heme ABC exporter ATP-binding protein CcmA [Acidobacteriota bacterium]
MAPVVLLRAAVATTGRFPALAGVDLELGQGEVVVLEGANGAGKTSVLRACAGLLPLSAGEATVLGHDLRRDAAAVRRAVGLLGHSPALYDDLTVAENLRFSLRAAGAPAAGRAELLGLLERTGLGGRVAATAAGRLSAGQRRRLGLAVVVGRAPMLWLLDEPHAGLDAEGRTLLEGVLAEALAAGASALVASHEPEVVVPLADRVLTMGGGRVVRSRRGGRRRVLAGGAHVA